jgi:hypothetical protein
MRATLVHPVVSAKKFVTADHISKRHFGLTIMFGVRQLDHEDPYKYELLFALSPVAAHWKRPSLNASDAEPAHQQLPRVME